MEERLVVEERIEWFLKETAETYIPGKTRIERRAFRSLFAFGNPGPDYLVVEIGPAQRLRGRRGLWCKVKLKPVS